MHLSAVENSLDTSCFSKVDLEGIVEICAGNQPQEIGKVSWNCDHMMEFYSQFCTKKELLHLGLRPYGLLLL